MGLLTTRERQVLDLFMADQNDAAIARKLGITPGRVAKLKKTALRRLYRDYRQSASPHLAVSPSPHHPAFRSDE